VELVTFLLPEAYLEGIEKLTELGRFTSRSEAVRSAVEEMIKSELWRARLEKAMRYQPISKIRA